MRHPRVLLSQPVCYGCSEVPVDDEHLQACAVALQQQFPKGASILTSERSRTQALAQCVAAHQPGVFSWRVDARLNEMDFGAWEMQPWDAIPKAAVDAWVADFPHHRFGGKESVQDVIDRVLNLLRDHMLQARDARCTDTIWICHAGVIRALRFLQHAAQERLGMDQGGRAAFSCAAWWQLRNVSEWPHSDVTYGDCQLYAIPSALVEWAGNQIDVPQSLGQFPLAP